MGDFLVWGIVLGLLVFLGSEVTGAVEMDGMLNPEEVDTGPFISFI